ncbi:MAG: VTT domain-containing protein [Myxococcota bacterium]|jgi:uncharacterized membrane protein YdjX (TVP38/TMEM64 family)|nr:VTT domain-containing protein [Myxococcota bacterium]
MALLFLGPPGHYRNMSNPPQSRDRRRWLTALGVGGFIAVAITLGSMVSIEDAKNVARETRQWSQSHLGLAVLCIGVAQFLSGVTGIPTKGVATLVAGALVGPLLSGVATLSGVAVGTTMLFFATRRLLGEYVRNRLGPRLAWVEERLAHRPIWSMIALRLMITLPYGPITMAAALSRVRYRDFLVGSIIGDLPVIALYSVAGSRLEALASTRDVIDPWSATLLLCAAIVMLASVLVRGPQKNSMNRPI